ncbi:hypothetical protein F4781DRAFT_397637, partial [Annulohypoxylon bovei var. microspora]
IETPEIETPEIETPEIETPEIETPEIETPEIETPEQETSEQETSEQELSEQELSEEDDESADVVVTGSKDLSPVDNKKGLDWEWVKTLDQNPKGKDYFPSRFTPPADGSSTGEDDDYPEVTRDTDMTDYTAWVLARVKKRLVNRTAALMVQDPCVRSNFIVSYVDSRSSRGS